MFQNMNFIKKLIPLLVVIPVGLYLFFRLLTGLQHVGPYLSSTWYIIRSGTSVGYDEKMLSLMGSVYLLYKNVEDNTLENDVICLPGGTSDVSIDIARYFWYPRDVEKLEDPNNFDLSEVYVKKCSYVVLYKGFPTFDISVKEIILFSDQLNGKSTVIKIDEYVPKLDNYSNRIGILQL